MPRFGLFVGSMDFLKGAQADMAAAKARVLVQAMTFEGDAAGRAVAGAIAAGTAQDRRVLVDDYTRHVINDRFLALSRDPALHAEAQATWAMFDGLIASGVGLRMTNPVGRNPLAYATRNHKKLLVIDDVAWIGGINFSDHNFAWHDMMLRIEDAEVAQWLAGEFDRDWQGCPRAARAEFGEIDLLSLPGNGNEQEFKTLLARIAVAQRSIEVISAYPTFPFVTSMAQAARRGVPVTLYTPRPNNKPVIRDYLMRVARKTGLSIRLLPEMTHMKAALIDGEALVVGSSNFDFVSMRANAEYVATISDPALIADAEARLFAPARALATEPSADDHSLWRGLTAAVGLRLADALIARLGEPRRIAEWERP
ncbi:MAG: phosphatidylserine/phosphatidylglycerophosphate/cardiolipin synthase family protein [Novosphingobium sp.]